MADALPCFGLRVVALCVQCHAQAVLDAQVQGTGAGLRQVANGLGAGRGLQWPQVQVAEVHACRAARREAGQAAQQRGLPDTVAAQDRHNASAMQGLGTEPGEHAPRAQCAVKLAQRQRTQCSLRRDKTRMKKGIPTSVVTMPTGISILLLSCLAQTDAPRRMMAPVHALAGRYQRWSSPQRRRAICGAMSPTKPMTPTSATDVAASTLTRIRAQRRTRRVSMPRLPARSSP